jgi:hypothetical protein
MSNRTWTERRHRIFDLVQNRLTPDSHLSWYPAEVAVTILADGQWFWALGKHSIKPLQIPTEETSN